MSPLLRKEVRLIGPIWIVAMILAILPVWFAWPGGSSNLFQGPGMAVFAPFGLGVLLLSVTPFGQELNLGTFHLLLAQPAPRRRLWLVKVTVLAVALGLAFAAFVVSNRLRVDSVMETATQTVWRNVMNRPGGAVRIEDLIAGNQRAAMQDSLMFGGLSALAAFAGGLWATLLFRQVSAALWFAFFVPMGLSLVAGKILSYFPEGMVLGLNFFLPDSIAAWGMIAVMVVYSVAGFLWARRLFLRAQDVQWTGGVIALPGWGGAAKTRSAEWGPKRRPLRAMIRKEFQSQYINLILAAGLLLVHLAALAIRKFGAGYFYSHRSVAMILESVPFLWLVLPLSVGAVAVAEERKLGTLESFLCLPTTRWRQFFVKFAVALVLGVLLGSVMPFAIERLGTSLGLTFNAPIPALDYQRGMLSSGTSAMVLSLLVAAGLTVLALYASTLTRNTLQALGAALAATVVAGGLIAVAAEPPNLGDVVLWRGALVGWIGWPLMLLVILALSYGNYKRVHVGSRIWFRNIFTLLLSLGCVSAATTTIYHRVWETWIPVEPTHREFRAFPFASMLLDPNNPHEASNRESVRSRLPKLVSAYSRTAVIRDGRLWQRRGRLEATPLVLDGNGHTAVQFRGTGPWHSGFVEGSDWREVAVTENACFAIKADGSLWDVSEVQPGETSPGTAPKRVGNGSDWKKLSAGGEHFLALKRDGTIWQWGHRYGEAERTTTPARIGSDADWTAVCDSGSLSLAFKSDGSLWRFGMANYVTNNTWQPRPIEQPERWLTGPANPPASISFIGYRVAVVYDDGSLWFGDDSSSPNGREAPQALVRWGSASDWLEVRLLDWAQAVGIKWNGSLWQWERKWWLEEPGLPGGLSTHPTMASEYLLWFSACPYGKSFLALAADGALCLWNSPHNDGHVDFPDEPNPNRLLLPSRIKARKIAELEIPR